MTSERQAELLAFVARAWGKAAVVERHSAYWYRLDMAAGRALSRCDSLAQRAMLDAYAIGRIYGQR